MIFDINFYGFNIPDILIQSILLIISFIIPLVGFIYLGTQRKIPIILKIRHIQFFKAEFFTETRSRRSVIILLSECKKLGHFYQFHISSGKYLVNPRAMFQSHGNPTIQYDEGNSIPIIIFRSESEHIDSQELDEVANNKIVHDLLKFTFTRLELLYLIIAIVGIGINIAVLYMSYLTQQDFSSLVNQLNGILKQLQAKPTG